MPTPRRVLGVPCRQPSSSGRRWDAAARDVMTCAISRAAVRTTSAMGKTTVDSAQSRGTRGREKNGRVRGHLLGRTGVRMRQFSERRQPEPPRHPSRQQQISVGYHARTHDAGTHTKNERARPEQAASRGHCTSTRARARRRALISLAALAGARPMLATCRANQRPMKLEKCVSRKFFLPSGQEGTPVSCPPCTPWPG